MRSGLFFVVTIVAVGAAAQGYDWSVNPGTGDPNNPYQISEPDHLIAIGSDPNLLAKHFILTNDIIFDPNNNQAHVFTTSLIAPDISIVSGFQGAAFSGFFDGHGHGLFNLKIDSGTAEYVGLFGSIDSGTVQHLTLTNVSLQAADYVGGLAGHSCGGSIIHDCHVEGNVNGSSYTGGFVGLNDGGLMTTCSARTVISTPDNVCFVGGFVGYHPQSMIGYAIRDCTSSGIINAGDDCDSIGGFAGANDGLIDRCSSDCQITTGSDCDSIGGFCGANYEGMLTHSFSEGLITCDYNNDQVGGLVGAGPGAGPNRGVEWCYSHCDIALPYSGCNNVGGLIGQTSGGSCRYCYTSRTLRINADTAGGLIGLHSGNLEHCYTTGDINGLNFLGGLVGTSTGGQIAYCYTTGKTEGLNLIGGLIGSNEGAEVIECSAAGQVIGGTGEYYGGLIGANKGTVRRCFATGSVSGRILAGGLIGDARSCDIINSYATGNVSGGNRLGGLVGTGYYTSITNCFSTGTVDASDHQDYGGLLGHDYGSTTLNSSYFLMSSGPDNGYGTPLDDPNMMIQANFSGWDFVGEGNNGDNEMWRMCVDGVETPRLSWAFARDGDFACGAGVDFSDLQALAEHWLSNAEMTPETFNYACDANGDEKIDMVDFGVFADHWLRPQILSGQVGNCTIEPMAFDEFQLMLESESLRFTAVVQGRHILFEDDIYANCCISGINLDMVVEGSRITLEEWEIPEALCMCMCTYPTNALLGPFSPGDYTFEVLQFTEDGYGGYAIITVGEIPITIE